MSATGGAFGERTAKLVALEIAALWAKAKENDADSEEVAEAVAVDGVDPKLIAEPAADKAKGKGKKKTGKKLIDSDPTLVLFLFSDAEWNQALKVAEKRARGEIEAIKLSDFLTGSDTSAHVGRGRCPVGPHVGAEPHV